MTATALELRRRHQHPIVIDAPGARAARRSTMMRVPARIGSILLLCLIVGGPWASTSNAQLVTDPVGFFTVKFPGDSQLAFSPGLVNAVELAGPVAGVSGNRLSFAGTAEESALEPMALV